MAADENGQDANSPQDSRLTSLDQRLDAIKREDAVKGDAQKTAASQRLIRSVGSRILSDLIGLPFGGGLIGWLLDRWFGTTPWIMLVGLFFGFGLAVRSVMRVANQRSEQSSGK